MPLSDWYFWGQKKEIPLFSPHQEVSAIVLCLMLEAPIVCKASKKKKKKTQKVKQKKGKETEKN